MAEKEQKELNFKLMRVILIFFCLISLNCNIMKQKNRKVENWKIDFFSSNFLNEDVESIYFYNVRQNYIKKESKVLISKEDEKKFLQGLDSLEYMGVAKNNYQYAVNIILPDTSYWMWGGGAYICPYKTGLTYHTPNKFDIMNYYFKKYME